MNDEIESLLADIRQVIGMHADAIPEGELLQALLGEADGWKMRLKELEEDE